MPHTTSSPRLIAIHKADTAFQNKNVPLPPRPFPINQTGYQTTAVSSATGYQITQSVCDVADRVIETAASSSAPKPRLKVAPEGNNVLFLPRQLNLAGCIRSSLAGARSVKLRPTKGPSPPSPSVRKEEATAIPALKAKARESYLPHAPVVTRLELVVAPRGRAASRPPSRLKTS